MCATRGCDVHCRHMRRSFFGSLAVCATLTLGATTAAAQRTPEPQAHEVRLDVDISVEKEANGAFIEGQYTFTPAKINRVDEVVAILRRFVRHPSSFWLRIVRFGYTREPVTGAAAGGVVQLGPAYVAGDVGIEYNVVDYDPTEYAYWAVPFTLEAGFRPMDTLSVGAFYSGRTIVGTSLDSFQVNQATRGGLDQRIGARVSIATPNDRVYAIVSGWAHLADWTFTGSCTGSSSPATCSAVTHEGDVTIRGFGASGRVMFQLTSSFTFALRLEFTRDSWVNERLGDDAANRVGVEVDRDVNGVRGGAEIAYWHKGRYGFRFGLGGGYQGAPPTVNNRETGIIQIGLGVITRF